MGESEELKEVKEGENVWDVKGPQVTIAMINEHVVEEGEPWLGCKRTITVKLGESEGPKDAKEENAAGLKPNCKLPGVTMLE